MPTLAMTPSKLRTFIRSTVRDELQNIFDDPDFGLALRPTIARRLARARRIGKKEKLFSVEDVAHRLGLQL